MKYAILLLAVSAWGQTFDTKSVPTCPKGSEAVSRIILTQPPSEEWECVESFHSDVPPKPSQDASQNAPLAPKKPTLTPEWQKEYDTFKADCERSRGIIEKLGGLYGFTCHYTPSQSFHNCTYRNRSSNMPNGQDTSEIYSCDEAVIELRGKWSQTIEHGVVYGTQLGRRHGEPSKAAAFDRNFFKWCPTPHPWDPQQKEMCGLADDPPKPVAKKKAVSK